MKFITNIFRKQTARDMAQHELEEAERQLLSSQATAEYATSLSQYNQNRIRRLQKYLQEAT